MPIQRSDFIGILEAMSPYPVTVHLLDPPMHEFLPLEVNGWFGDYNKLSMTKLFVLERWGLVLDDQKDRFIFCGDSPNDEPMFDYFPHAAGVKNILNFAERMRHLPAFVASREGGEGFAEIVHTLLGMRAAK